MNFNNTFPAAVMPGHQLDQIISNGINSYVSLGLFLSHTHSLFLPLSSSSSLSLSLPLYFPFFFWIFCFSIFFLSFGFLFFAFLLLIISFLQKIGAEIGRGAFAIVFQAKNEKTGEFVALKRFHVNSIENDIDVSSLFLFSFSSSRSFLSLDAISSPLRFSSYHSPSSS